MLAAAGPARADALAYCDHAARLDAADHDRLLRVGAVVRGALEASGARVALLARSGLALERFGIRYSHAGVSLRASTPSPWAVRQLYYACDESRPRLFDQGIAAFVIGTADPKRGFVSALVLRGPEADALERTAADEGAALALLGARYSANAYAFGDRFQNCNQWLAELLALAWAEPGRVGRGAAARADAQRWLRAAGYTPHAVAVNPLWMWLAAAVPWVHNAGHPADDLAAGVYRISLPEAIESFARRRVQQVERIEFCHDERRVVVRRDGVPFGAACAPAPGDTVVALQ